MLYEMQLVQKGVIDLLDAAGVEITIVSHDCRSDECNRIHCRGGGGWGIDGFLDV